MKASYHVGRGMANHNDRSAGYSIEHCDETKASDNMYFAIDGNNKLARVRGGQGVFSKAEKEYYATTYQPMLDRKNAVYKKHGHKQYIKTPEQYYVSNPPHEAILQIGNAEHPHTHDETFEAVYGMVQLMARDKNVKVLDFAIHCDESVPHAHVRYVINYQTKNNDIEVNASKGLQQMGYMAHQTPQQMRDTVIPAVKAKHPEIADWSTNKAKKMFQGALNTANRLDNPIVTYTEIQRTRWYDMLENELGYNIDRTVSPACTSHKHRSQLEYNAKKLAKENAHLAAFNSVSKLDLNKSERLDNDLMRDIIEEYGLSEVMANRKASRYTPQARGEEKEDY